MPGRSSGHSPNLGWRLTDCLVSQLGARRQPPTLTSLTPCVFVFRPWPRHPAALETSGRSGLQRSKPSTEGRGVLSWVWPLHASNHAHSRSPLCLPFPHFAFDACASVSSSKQSWKPAYWPGPSITTYLPAAGLLQLCEASVTAFLLDSTYFRLHTYLGTYAT